jgi:hypothetical protein
MPNQKEQLLAAADQHIADGEQRLTRQRRLIERLSAIPCDTTVAEKLAGEIETYIGTAREHRRVIMRQPEEG